MAKCKICNKPIKEDTWRNNRYCQGHGIFEQTQIACKEWMKVNNIEKRPRADKNES